MNSPKLAITNSSLASINYPLAIISSSLVIINYHFNERKARGDYSFRLILIELKINKLVGAAMSQIEQKGCPARFAMQQLPVVKVGVNFDLSERNHHRLGD